MLQAYFNLTTIACQLLHSVICFLNINQLLDIHFWVILFNHWTKVAVHLTFRHTLLLFYYWALILSLNIWYWYIELSWHVTFHWLMMWLLLLLQDSRLSLQIVLLSPHLTELRSFARTLESALGEVEELLDLWVSCQNQACSTYLQ